MKFQFDKNQTHQLEAIQSVIDLFKTSRFNKSVFDFFAELNNSGLRDIVGGIGNVMMVSEDDLLSNLINVQKNNGLIFEKSTIALKKLSYIDEENNNKSIQTSFPNFSVEMETGTGKTYVYLRSIYELHKTYGFKKFVIVVPSVAIREGVVKSLNITRDHFREVYQHQPAEYKLYDSVRLNQLEHFFKSNDLQILVINIDSFAKDSNIINQLQETGVRPIEYIQWANPVVIIDEPQNMETNIRKKAIANLNPLFTLRYSATHKNAYNLVYKLDPVRAYDLGLVKQIEVDSVVSRPDDSGVFISVDSFKMAKQSLSVKITIFVNENSGVKKKQVLAKAGDDLFSLSKGCEVYKDGFVINELNAERKNIVFSNGTIVEKENDLGGLKDHILKEMIDATVENHLKKEYELLNRGIKVLSIFFIDKVNNYRTYDATGNTNKGKFALWLEESFAKWKNLSSYKNLFSYHSKDVHDGYFSQDKGMFRDTKEGKFNKADDETYKLIMRDKERLLNIDTPLRFIFSHSALREGWDNPNIFQICTLNETKSEIKKRQEIGRGLRLCVDQTGKRNFERSVNRLTIIANESYDNFCKSLQHEIEQDCGVKFNNRIKNVKKVEEVLLKNKQTEDDSFSSLWERVKHNTEYKFHYNTDELINNCVTALKRMADIKKTSILREKNTAVYRKDEYGNVIELSGKQTLSKETIVENTQYQIPDFVTYIQSKTELTRNTIIQIILKSNRVGEIFNNPQLFMDSVINIVNRELCQLTTHGIQYEYVSKDKYEMKLIESVEIKKYINRIVATKKKTKESDGVYRNSLNKELKKIPENEDSEDNYFCCVKIDDSFNIKTPIGSYHPEWAIVENDNTEKCKIYFTSGR